jgi:hypothetical protein
MSLAPFVVTFTSTIKRCKTAPRPSYQTFDQYQLKVGTVTDDESGLRIVERYSPRLQVRSLAVHLRPNALDLTIRPQSGESGAQAAKWCARWCVDENADLTVGAKLLIPLEPLSGFEPLTC